MLPVIQKMSLTKLFLILGTQQQQQQPKETIQKALQTW